MIVRLGEIGVLAAAAEGGISVRTARKWQQRFALTGEAGCAIRPAARTECGQRYRKLTVRRHSHCASNVERFETSPSSCRGRTRRPAKCCLDTKKLGRIVSPSHRVTGDRRDSVNGAAWDVLHLAIDDHSQLAYTEVLTDEKRDRTTGFLDRAIDWFATHGVTTERIMTDNGSAYRSRCFAEALGQRGIAHRFTRPYTPRTNGKAERFVQTALREWAYAHTYRHSAERAHQLADWQHFYNHHRRHSARGSQPPISRMPRNNLSNLNS